MIRALLPHLKARLAVVAALLAANVGLLAAGLLPALDRVLDRDARIPRLEARARALEVEERSRRAQAESRAQAEAYAATFPPRAEMLAVTARLQRVTEQFDVVVPAIEYRPESKAQDGAPLSRVTVAMSVEGPYRELRRLLYAIERQRRHVVIERAALRKRSGPGGEDVQLVLELSAYFR